MPASGWRTVTLGEVINLKRGYDLSTPDRKFGKIPVVSSSGITGFHDRAMVEAPGVVTGRYGTLGEVFYLTEDFWPLNTTLYVQDFKGNHPRFIAYFLKGSGLSYYNDKSSVPGLNRNDLHRLEVTIPPYPEQEAIAHILGALDDKIELNQRMNETLEAMARAIFKSWFVDFDPVRAKIEGRQLAGMDAETAALFPHSFEDSPQSKIPKGWAIQTLGDALSVLETGWRPKGGVKDIIEGVPSVGAESIVGLGRYDYGKAKYVPREFFDSMNRGHVVDRDVLLYKDGGRPGEFEPHVSMFGDGFPFREFCINEHVYRLRATAALSQAYLYFWLESDAIIEEMRNRGTGVAVPGLNSTALRSIPVLIPSAAVMRLFTNAIDSLISRIFANSDENRSLATIRDALLPKLLSGEVRVKDADKFVEANT